MEELGKVAHGGRSRWDQRYAAGLGLIQEQFDDATASPPSGKDEGGRPEVGHCPLGVVLDEVGRCGRQGGSVPPQENVIDGMCQGLLPSTARGGPRP